MTCQPTSGSCRLSRVRGRRQAGRARASAVLATVVLATVALTTALAGCGTRSTGTPTGGSVTTTPTPSGGTTPSGDTTTALTVVVDDGAGKVSTWTLTCDPAGGTHPDAAQACRVLAAAGERALPAVPAGTMCTEQYGGPQKARITGTWRGTAVDASLSRTDGCQIARW